MSISTPLPADAVASALRHECPTCGQAPGRACVTAGGHRAARPHNARLRRAGRHPDPAPTLTPL